MISSPFTKGECSLQNVFSKNVCDIPPRERFSLKKKGGSVSMKKISIMENFKTCCEF